MSIRGRVVEDENGRMVLLAPDHGRAIVLAKSDRTGKLVQKISGDGPATFSGNIGRSKPEPPAVDPRNAVLTRAECAVLLDVSIEEAARILDEGEVGRHLGFDAAHVRALAEARATAPMTATLTLPVGPLEPVEQ